MKNTQTLFKMLAIAIIVIAFFCSDIYAQGGGPLWQPLGPDTVFTTRNVKINRGLRVLEKIVAESIDANSIFARSIEVKDYLKVGDNAIVLVPTLIPSDDIRSDIGVIALMEGTNTTFSSNIQVGIGTQTPTSKLHVFDGNAMVSNTGIFPGNLRGYYIQGRKAIAMPGNTSNFFTNLAVGDSAGSSITTGTQNVLMGRSAG